MEKHVDAFKIETTDDCQDQQTATKKVPYMATEISKPGHKPGKIEIH